jgi:hypothetical protein
VLVEVVVGADEPDGDADNEGEEVEDREAATEVDTTGLAVPLSDMRGVVNKGLSVEEPVYEDFAEADEVAQSDELPDAVPVQELHAVLLAVAVGVRTADRVDDFVAVEVSELVVVPDAIDVADKVKVAVVEAVVVIVGVAGAEADAVEVGAWEPLNDAVPLPVEDPVALAIAVRDTAPSTPT